MRKSLESNPKYMYRIKALGFADYNLTSYWLCRFFNPLSSRIPLFSPTVAYVGHAKINFAYKDR